MTRDRKVRIVNAVCALILVVFYAVHATMGTLFSQGLISDELATIAWAGVIFCAGHIVLSIFTTVFMLRDDVRPPSERKKRHQLLKWITGAVVLALLALHLTVGDLTGDIHLAVGVALALALLAALVVHVYTGTKSLTRDLRVTSRARTPFRVVVIALSICIGVAFLLAAWQ